MIICSKCGGENEESFKFCFHCGAPLKQPKPEPAVAWPSDCPQCGAGLTEGQRFCGGCGFNVEQFVQSAAPPPAAPVAPSPQPAQAPTPESPSGTGVQVAAPQVGTERADYAAPDVPAPTTHGDVACALVFIQPDGRPGDSFPLQPGQQTIGRSSGPEMFGRDEFLAAQHAEFTLRDGTLSVKEVDPNNGVFVRSLNAEPLQHGDEIRIGKERLRFELLTECAPERPGTDETPVLGAPTGSAWGRLVRISSYASGDQVHLLHAQEHQLGRERGDILFNGDHYVSGLHARIYRNGDQTFLEDLKSSNGTFLRIRSEAALLHGSLLLMGSQPFKVQLT